MECVKFKIHNELYHGENKILLMSEDLSKRVSGWKRLETTSKPSGLQQPHVRQVIYKQGIVYKLLPRSVQSKKDSRSKVCNHKGKQITTNVVIAD